MKKKTVSFDYEVVDTIEKLAESDQSLVQAAKNAMQKAYAPYSNFLVGAAALLHNGEVISGGNMENAAYPMCICAEGVILSSVESNYPRASIQTIAITAKSNSVKLMEPPSPCGSCRQMICEKENRQQAPIRIILFAEDTEIYILNTIKDILPFSFDGSVL